MTTLAGNYAGNAHKRTYRRMADMTGQPVLAEVHLELIANFSFIPQLIKIIKTKLEPYNIDAYEFSAHFDSATFEYFPKRLKATVYVFEHYFSFDFTKPQWLGRPRSKGTDCRLLGKTPVAKGGPKLVF